jgi:hypothetical protein
VLEGSSGKFSTVVLCEQLLCSPIVNLLFHDERYFNKDLTMRSLFLLHQQTDNSAFIIVQAIT